jgi:hypothetical protein
MDAYRTAFLNVSCFDIYFRMREAEEFRSVIGSRCLVTSREDMEDKARAAV